MNIFKVIIRRIKNMFNKTQLLEETNIDKKSEIIIEKISNENLFPKIEFDDELLEKIRTYEKLKKEVEFLEQEINQTQIRISNLTKNNA